MDGLETMEMLGIVSSVNLVFYVGLQWGRPECILVAEAVSEEVFRRRSSIHQTPGLRTLPASYMVRGEMYV